MRGARAKFDIAGQKAKNNTVKAAKTIKNRGRDPKKQAERNKKIRKR